MLTNETRSKEEEICLLPSQLLPLLLSQQMIVDACHLTILFIVKEREIDPWRTELIF